MPKLKSSVRFMGSICSEYGEFDSWDDFVRAHPEQAEVPADKQLAYVSCDSCTRRNITVPVVLARTQMTAIEAVLSEGAGRLKRSGERTVVCPDCAAGTFHWLGGSRIETPDDDEIRREGAVVAKVWRMLNNELRKRDQKAPFVRIKPGREPVFFVESGSEEWLYPIADVLAKGIEATAAGIRSNCKTFEGAREARVELGTFGGWPTWVRESTAWSAIVQAHFDSASVGDVFQARFDLGKRIWLDEPPMDEFDRNRLGHALVRRAQTSG